MPGRDYWFDEVGARDKYAAFGDCQELDFTHGIEVEYFLVDQKGNKISHAEFGEIYDSILTEWIKEALENNVPRFYDIKITSLEVATSQNSTYDALYCTYRTRGKNVKAELISVDRNVAEWPLIEIATPPCESFYELGWWSSTLLTLINFRLNAQGYKNHIMPFGVNPNENLMTITQTDTFPTCGEHHHIKLIDPQTMGLDDRVFFTNFYHLVRFFTAYLILLSACSPFTSRGLWGRFSASDPEMPFPRCVRSIRVLYNKKHLCNFQEGEYMPYLEKGWLDKRYFVEEFKRQSNSYRTDTHFLDIDPISKANNTTEIRFFDSQPSVARRVGLAILIQMLARKAKKLVSEDEDNLLEILKEPNETLHALKKTACEGGNWFRPSKDPIFGELSDKLKLKKSRIEKNILSDLALGMMYIIRTEIKESNVIYSHFLDPIRQSIYGMDGNGISPAQYWLFTHVKNNMDMNLVMDRILEASRKGMNMWYDPIVNEPIFIDNGFFAQDNR
jgi:gamma-glutamyl:cysteine ligase YbdK (ATP-grasp superfamily)